MNQGYYNNGYNNANNANNPYYNQGMYNNRNYPPNPNNPYYMNGNRMNPNMPGNMNGQQPQQPQQPNKPGKIPRSQRPRKPRNLTNRKGGKLLPLFIIVGVLVVLAVILLIVLITKPREEDKKPVEDNPITEKDQKVHAEQIVGSEENGYVSIPVEWVVFEDSVTKDEKMLQYSTTDAQYILTMDYYDKKIDNYSGANNMAIAMKKDGATNLKAAKVDIAGYNGYMVSGVYPDGVTLVAYFIQPEDGVTRCIMVEGPDPTNSAFNIPKTFQLKKDE